MFKKNKNKQKSREPYLADDKTPKFSYYRSSNNYNVSKSRSENTPTRKQKNTSRLLQRRKQLKSTIRWRYIPSMFAIIAVFIMLLWNTTLSSSPTIVMRNDKYKFYNDVDVYESSVASIIDNSIFNRSKLLINIAGIEDEIKKIHPEISQASLTVPIIGSRPVIQLIFSEPLVEISSNNANFYVDNRGLVVASDNTKSVSAHKAEIKASIMDISDFQYQPGKRALTAENIEFFVTVSRILNSEYNISLPVFTIGRSPQEVELLLPEATYTVKMSLINDVNFQVGSLLTYLDALKEGSSAEPAEYIDIRLGNRIFVR